MIASFKKISCLLLALLLFACALTGCQKTADPMAKSGVGSVTLDGKGRINVSVSLDIRTVQAHTDEKAYLYELLPGEDVTMLGSRAPLDEAKISSSIEFRFPLETDGSKARLFSSFVVGFEDGSFLSTDGVWIENPQALATDTRAFPWSGSPKGLAADSADDASTLGAKHVMYEIRLSEFFSGVGSFSFDGSTYTISDEQLTALDEKVDFACRAGLQVSLTVIPDSFPSYRAFAALIDYLAARYTHTEGTSLSAVFIKGTEGVNNTLLCRLTHQALRSHVANGRVYVTSTASGMTDVKTFFSTLQAQISAGGDMDWGVAVVPSISDTAPWEESADTDTLTVSNLSALSSFLFTAVGSRPDYFAVCDIAYSATDENDQAVRYAYAYRTAAKANAGMIFYREHLNDTAGLRTQSGEERRITSLFERIDSGLSSEDRLLCERTVGAAWQTSVSDLISNIDISGVANVGMGNLDENALFDFTDGSTHGFCGVGALDEPESHTSAAWDAPVLYTWINPEIGDRGGVRKVLDNASALEGASALSIQLLTQMSDTETCTAYLTIEGEKSDGTRLTYESRVEIKNSTWQTVTCQIGNFTSEADLSRPCVITLTTEPTADVDEDYVLWVKGIDLRTPSGGMGTVLPIILILACVIVGFVAVFFVYHKTTKRRR